MEQLERQIRHTLLLPLVLGLYISTPWISEQTGANLTLFRLAGAFLCAWSIVVVWMDIILLRGAPPESTLLHTNPGKRELLWRLADTPGLERQGWSWQFKAVGAWVGYGAGFATAAAVLWYSTRSASLGRPVIVAGAGTLVVSAVLILSRLAFERWATAHPETVERILNTPQAQLQLEQDQAE